jgi:HlyD family secretion protein
MRSARRILLLAVGAALALLVAQGAAGRLWNRQQSGVLLASGTIEATEVRVSFKVSGRVVERPVDEGARVEAGALIGRLESLDLQADVERLRGALRSTETLVPQRRTEIAMLEELTDSRIAEAQAGLVSREQQLAELRAGARAQELQIANAEVREAKANLDNAEADLKRISALYERELVAAQSRDAAQTAHQVAREKYRAALERLDLVKEGPRQEQIARAEADVRQVRAALLGANTGKIGVLQKQQELATLEANIARDRGALAVAKAQLGYTILKSPQAGVVLRKHVEPGEIIAAGTPAVTIADLRNVWLKIYVPEPQLGRVKLGQLAEIRTDSYPGKVYRGEVTFINSEAEFTPKNVQTQEERVKLVFAVKISVDNAHQELKPGMPADAKVHLE